MLLSDSISQLYGWQREAIAEIRGRDAIVSAPTGAGKTKVAYIWAGLLDENGRVIRKPEGQKVIFTAPIKALSNERYMDLKGMGFDVGLETGDFKKNTKADIICCTQEIYTLKYARQPNLKVIIDEFHYISTDPRRSRAYIDGVKGTHPDSKILVMSATFGHPEHLRRYLDKLTGREFKLYTTDQRITQQVFLEEPADLKSIHDALVFVFSYRGAVELAAEIAYYRDYLEPAKLERLEELARHFKLSELPEFVDKGVGVYVGSMLPKEKLFMEMAFRERLLDVIVGTDALSLGVNLPAETVVFAQLAKYYEGPITKNEFLQMAGRAGRKGYYDTGYVTYYPSAFESLEYDTEELYRYLLKAPQEQLTIQLQPSIPDILRGKSIDEEAEYVAKFSYPPLSKSEVMDEITEIVEIIDEYAEQYAAEVGQERFKKVLADVYFSEYSLHTNLALASLFATETDIQTDDIVDVVLSSEDVKSEFYAILQVKRYVNSLPGKYRDRIEDMESIDEYIEQVDPTVTRFEEMVSEIQRPAQQLDGDVIDSFIKEKSRKNVKKAKL